MPAERESARPVSKNRKPDGFEPYKVKDGDSWKKIAERYGLGAGELAYENVGTTNPFELHSYTQTSQECSQEPPATRHSVVSADTNLETIYVPKRRSTIPRRLDSDRRVPNLNNVWAGIAKAHSGDLFVGGAHDLTGMVYNLGDSIPDVRNAVLNINGSKIGLGLGGSVSAVFVLCHGYNSAEAMNGSKNTFDFDLALGPKLSSAIKSLRYFDAAVDTVQKYKKTRYIAENLLKNKDFAEGGIFHIPIPFAGAGLHAWIGYKFGDVSVMRTGKGII